MVSILGSTRSTAHRGERFHASLSLATPTGRRLGLLAACALAIAAAAVAGDPSPILNWDPELAVLLRGMAAIKAGFALLIIALLWWRLESPLSPAAYGASTLCAAAIAGSAMMVWQLDFIIMTSIIFHTTLITLCLLALRDSQVVEIAKRRLGKRRARSD